MKTIGFEYYSTGKSSATTTSGTSFTKRNSHGYSSTITPIKPLVIGLTYNNQKLTTKQQETASKNSNIIINNSQTMTYRPANWFSAQYSQTLSESESPLLNQEGSVQ